MKPCSYCGQENDDTASHCSGCATPFVTEPAGRLSDAIRWTPRSAFGLAITSGFGALFISTGVFYLVGRLMLEFLRMHHPGKETSIAVDIVSAGMTANYADFAFIHPTITGPLLFVASVAFTFFVCYNRCKKEVQGVVTTIITMGIIFLQTIGPMFSPRFACFLNFVPMIQIGGTGGSVGYYLGAALQLSIGVWLLGCFNPHNSRDANYAA